MNPKFWVWICFAARFFGSNQVVNKAITHIIGWRGLSLSSMIRIQTSFRWIKVQSFIWLVHVICELL